MPLSLHLLRRLVLGLLVLPVAVAAQPAPLASDADSCAVPLAEAQQRYVDQEFAAVEPLVLACVDRPDAGVEHRVEGFRLLALAFIRQDLLHEAQMTVLKLLGADYGYEPDAVQDPPFYVALVGSIKEQLRVAPLASLRASPPVEVLNVNTATEAELVAIPGIGPVMAQRIVAYRAANGPFQRVDDLDAVSGIGPRTLERLAPYLTTAWTVRAGGGVAAAAPSAPVPLRAAPPPPVVAPDSRVNLNTASAAELEALNGIGPALAARILAYREQVGRFRTVEELVEVRGIGPRTLERLAPYVTVGGADE